MPPKKTREQCEYWYSRYHHHRPKRLPDARRAHNVAATSITPEVIAKRTKRHLNELEVGCHWQHCNHNSSTTTTKRSNYAEPAIWADDEGGKSAKGRARQTVSDKRNLNILGNSAAGKKKKSTMNVRTALLYRKNLPTLVEDSVRETLSPRVC